MAENAYKSGDYKAALTRGFLAVDEKLNKGGLKDIAEMRTANPPNKSKMMQIFQEVVASKSGEGPGAAQNDLELDSIGCTANVMLVDYDRRKFYVGNAGDSRCVMGAGGKCTALSFDHKPEC